MLSNNQDPSARGFPCILVCSGAAALFSPDLILSLHQLAEQACPLPSSAASLFMQFASPPFSSSYFIPSPLHIIPSPLCPHPLPLTLSHPPLCSHLSDSSSLFFFHHSSSHPPSCCSEFLKGTELGGALGCGLKSLRVAPYPDLHASLKCPNAVRTCETQKATRSHQI